MFTAQFISLALGLQAFLFHPSIEQRIQIPPHQQSSRTIESQKDGEYSQDAIYYFVTTATENQAQPKAQDSTQTTQEAKNQPSEASEYLNIASHRIKITDGLLVLFTGFLVLFTFGLVLVGRRQDTTTKQQNRAFIGISAASLTDKGTDWPENLGTPQISEEYFRNAGAFIAIKNSGSTPAHNVRHMAMIDIRRSEDEHLVFPPRIIPRQSMAAIPPGGMITKSIIRPARITMDELEAVKAGSSNIYVCGSIHYTDAFGKDRLTNYKMKWAGRYPFHPSIGGVFCDDGNEAT